MTNENLKSEGSKRSKLAVAAMILGLLSILLPIPVAALRLHPLSLIELLVRDFIWLLPLVALVVGIIALRRINKYQELLKGKIWASVGILLSALPLLISLLVIPYDIVMYAKSGVATIDNVTKDATVVLFSGKDKEKMVSGLSIYISGYIDGSATISLCENDQNVREYEISSGKVCIRRSGDWYNNECLIKYKPTNVSSGYLKIRYYFDDFF